MKKKMLHYKRTSLVKRVIAFFSDLFIILLSTLILVVPSFYIYFETPVYKNNLEIKNALKVESNLYIDDTLINEYYLNNNELTFNEKSELMNEKLLNFYLNSKFNKDESGILKYKSDKENAKRDNKYLFKKVDEEYVRSDEDLKDEYYFEFYYDEVNVAINIFRNNKEIKDIAFNNSLTLTLITLIEFFFVSFIFFYLIPVFDRRNHRTLGMKIFKFSLISNNGISLSTKEFTFRFLFFYIFEYILGFASLLLFSLISFSFMLLNKKEQPLHDLITNSMMIEVEGDKVYLSKLEYEKHLQENLMNE